MKCKMVKLSDVCDLIAGFAFKSKDFGDFEDKVIKIADIVPPRVEMNNLRGVNLSNYNKDKIKRFIAKPGDYVLAMTGATIGKIGRIYEKSAYINQRVLLFRPHKEINKDFLYYSICTKGFYDYLISFIDSETAQPNISATTIGKYELYLPPLNTQNKIASILQALDNKIELNNKINDDLYEMVNVYYKKLFTAQKSELTTIDTYALKIYSGGTPTTSNAEYWKGTFNWLSSGETRNRFIVSTEKTITQEGISNSSTKLAHKYDIVMASAGQGFTRGQTSMLLLDTYVNQSVIVIHADKIYLPFIFWNLANRYEELRAISDSSSIRGSLTTKMIASFEIPVADSSTIADFSDFAWSIIPQIESNLLENARLTMLKDLLLPKLMSGEIDVSNIQL